MSQVKHKHSLASLRVTVGAKVRELRAERRWTQSELAARLEMSQARLSLIERGQTSLTAEQFLTLLALFNVTTNAFVPAMTVAERRTSLQNTLARLGAIHLHESETVVPDASLERLDEVLKAVLVSDSPRMMTALAPVLVLHVDQIAPLRLYDNGAVFVRRLGWVLENVQEALRLETTPAPTWIRIIRRAQVVLESLIAGITEVWRTWQNSAVAAFEDVLDGDIRSAKTRRDVAAAASAISRKWGIVTRLQPEDFLSALRASYDRD